MILPSILSCHHLQLLVLINSISRTDQLAPDLPEIRVELLTDGKSVHGPFGAKSIGEVSYVPAAPAVCGAVNDALRAHLGTLPFTPDRILTYLAEKETSQ